MAKKFIPGSTITQGFGPSRFNYRPFGITKNNGYFHDGQDEGARTGTKIPAPQGGKITYRGYEPGGAGNFVIFKGKGGWEILLMHLSKFPSMGAKKKGEAIGYVGSTGNSTGPHTHFTVYPPHRNRRNGVRGAVNPQSYLSKLGVPPKGRRPQSLATLNKIYQSLLRRNVDPGGRRTYQYRTVAYIKSAIKKSKEYIRKRRGK